MAKKKKSDTPKAADLLPPDGPAPVDPKSVPRSDDPLEPEVETRKIGIRRVSSLEFGNRMVRRLNRRSAGNSRSFWRNIEADDPFLKAPARPTDAPLEIYPAQRLHRTSGSQPKPQPDVARAYPPPSREESTGNRPKPMREAKSSTKRVEPTHTPEPRPAKRPPPRPTPPRAVEPPAPEPVSEPEPVAAPSQPGRRLPPKPANKKKGSGRLRTGRKRMPSQAPPAARAKSAAEIRAEKQRIRDEALDQGEKKPVSNTTLDQYRDYVGMMAMVEEAIERGEDPDLSYADQVEEPVRRPKPKAEAKRPKPKAEAPPKPAKPSVDRTPPKPKSEAKEKAPVNRSPSGGGGGGLDDLFGGAVQQEGRVKIPKRSKPKAPSDEEEED